MHHLAKERRQVQGIVEANVIAADSQPIRPSSGRQLRLSALRRTDGCGPTGQGTHFARGLSGRLIQSR
jgi:hypothetical protein